MIGFFSPSSACCCSVVAIKWKVLTTSHLQWTLRALWEHYLTLFTGLERCNNNSKLDCLPSKGREGRREGRQGGKGEDGRERS